MTKRFNVTGLCFPEQHYMADISKKLDKTMQMVEQGDYFVINRPRQYGKTTLLYRIADLLTAKGYVVLNMSFEGLGDAMFENEPDFAEGFAELLATYASVSIPDLEEWLLEKVPTTQTLKQVSKLITQFVSKTDKKIVLLIDEVDKSSNNQLFVSFLAMLRNKFLERGTFKTFHSVVLAGLHDVKTLKLKLRPDDERKLNSPWNIAADYTVDMNLQIGEIEPMLADYCHETGVAMDISWFAARLFYHTSGYPFLVSRLCKTIAEDIVPDKTEKTWTSEDLAEAVERLLRASNTNFDSLIKSLENDQALYDLVYGILMEGDMILFNIHDPLLNIGLLHGIFRNDRYVKIHNRIYEQVIYNYMTSKTTTTLKSKHNYAEHFVLDNDGLDMPAVLLKFQQFMKEEYNEKDKTFLEQHGRLVFLSFLNPILNGKGHSFKEVQTSEEKRLDIVATYNEHKYIIELKRWYGEVSHQKGIAQLSDYLDIHALKAGFLVIFEYNKKKSNRKEWIEYGDKKIFAVWI